MRLILILTVYIFWNTLLSSAENADSIKVEQFSIHAQTTVISQFKPAFHVPYTRTNSLIPQKETKTSITSTLFAGLKLWKNASVYINPEIAGGSGLSSTLGIAAAPNGETYRVGNPAPQVTLARLYVQQLFLLSNRTEYLPGDFNQLAGRMPLEYLRFTVGKIGVVDFFDDNKFSHDPRTQFMSWGLMDCGAWDYPANTKGYIPAFVMEYVNERSELRYSFSLEPKEANGNEINWNIARSNSHTLEYTFKYNANHQPGAIRILGFYSTANMGNYTKSIELSPESPSVLETRQAGRTKYGFVLNAEQSISENYGVFLKTGWNDGHNETWAFTEIDHSIQAGFSSSGIKWKRENDRAGIAYVVSGISNDHRNYLAAGGTGFMLGDGKLNYALEQLTEFYYSACLLKNNIYFSGAFQLLLNPGYNRDRHGPVTIFSVRAHARI